MHLLLVVMHLCSQRDRIQSVRTKKECVARRCSRLLKQTCRIAYRVIGESTQLTSDVSRTLPIFLGHQIFADSKEISEKAICQEKTELTVHFSCVDETQLKVPFCGLLGPTHWEKSKS